MSLTVSATCVETCGSLLVLVVLPLRGMLPS